MSCENYGTRLGTWCLIGCEWATFLVYVCLEMTPDSTLWHAPKRTSKTPRCKIFSPACARKLPEVVEMHSRLLCRLYARYMHETVFQLKVPPAGTVVVGFRLHSFSCR